MTSNNILDADGQPENSTFRAQGRKDRTVDELIGISKALVSDGILVEQESDFLCKWLRIHAKHARDSWPVDCITGRVCQMLSDGVIDQDERLELFELLQRVAGGNTPQEAEPQSSSTRLPFTDPPPDIDFRDGSFCFTGKFAFGARKKCQEEVRTRGGRIQDDVTSELGYLVVGIVGSRDWMHTTHGRKIERAVYFQKEGCELAIVSEEHWVKCLLRFDEES